MKAVVCTHYGTVDDLQLTTLPVPIPAPGEAVIDIKAVGLNFFDTLLVAGKYQLKPELPFSPGAEFAGVVESVGEGVSGVRVGERVFGYANYGAARERMAVAAEALFPIPQGLDFARAASLIVTYGTTYYALKERGGLRAGETLAVLGAAGGVGLAAVELGKLLGAHVIACASSAEKCAFARAHGADATVDYSRTDLRDALRACTQGRGVDVVYDPVGGAFSEAALRALGWYGRLLVIGFAAGEIPKLPLNLTLLKSCDIRGVFWGAWTRREPAMHRANTLQLAQWCAEGKLSAHVHAAYPLAQAAEALNVLGERRAMGKVVLQL